MRNTRGKFFSHGLSSQHHNLRMILRLLLPALLFSLLLSACSEKEYQGDAVLNYPDMQVILNDYLKPYEKAPNTFREVQWEGKTRDTAFRSAADMPWKKIEETFLQANLFDSTLDRQYKIDVLTDTINSNMSMVYTSLNPANAATKLVIKASLYDNKIRSLYAEVRDAGFFASTEYKLLYLPGKTIQIQEMRKRPFSDPRRKVTTWSFLSGG